MGGKVFELVKMPNGGPPELPRMSPDLYKRMIAECQPRLEALFRNVVVPRDAPGKVDYGDVDFLVEGILPTTPVEFVWETTKTSLGAELHVPRNQSQSFGIPHPDIPGAFVQVDVELSPGSGTPDSAELFEWTKFMKGDADLLQIIGIAHRLLGITCNDRGLHVRLEQIEPYDKKKALLFLTRDPVQAMQFYGFDVGKYYKGFESETDLFDWVAAGRFFSPEIFERRVERSDDRSRHSKRPMYRHFVDDYMPKTNRDSGDTWSREDVLREAINTFGVRAEYDAMMATHRTKVAEEELWKEIKATIPAKDKALAAAVRALRRRVVFDSGKPQTADTPTPPEEYIIWVEHVSKGNKQDVLTWVEKNWREVKSRDKAGLNAARA
ncbi:hypothetical protein N0V95_009618 [Ascochyta clinopodiicola]|nr:hypothetical protein N0V95_009618 [Ascochyta clinopodiicola]